MFLLAALGETLYHSQIEYKYELINGFWGVFFFVQLYKHGVLGGPC